MAPRHNVCDLSLWAPFLILAHTQPVPVAVMSVTAACILPGPDAPAWGQGLPRPRTAAMRMRAQLPDSYQLYSRVHFQREWMRWSMSYRFGPLSCAVTERAGQMPLYLVPSAPEFDYDHKDLPPSVHYVTLPVGSTLAFAVA